MTVFGTYFNLYKQQILILYFVVCILIIGIIFRESVLDIVREWVKFDQSMGHGILVFLTSAYLAHRNWSNALVSSWKPEFKAIIPLSLLSVFWGVADIVDIEIIQQILVPVILLLSICLVFGRIIAGRMLVPVLFLYFGINFWDYLTGSLVALAATVVQSIVKLSGITAFIEGSSIFLPDGEIVIARGCSGVRYLIVGLFLSILSGYLYYQSMKKRLMLVVSCLSLALLANWFRIYIIIYIADVTKMQSSIIHDHETLGWIVFFIFMLPLFVYNYYHGNGARLEKVEKSTPNSDSNIKAFTSFFVLLICLNFSSLVPAYVNQHSLFNGKKMNFLLPPVSGWKRISDDFAVNWWASERWPEGTVSATYRNSKNTAQVTIFPYYKENQNDEILPYMSSIYNEAVWASKKKSIGTVHIGEKVKFEKNYLVNKYNQEKMIMMNQYNIGGMVTLKRNIAKLLQIPAALSGNSYAILTIVTFSCYQDCQKEEQIFLDFLETGLAKLSHLK